MTIETEQRARIPFVDLVAQYESIADEIDSAFHEVTRSAEFILGTRVQRFEEEFAAYVAADHAVGVGSGLDALRLGLLALGVGQGDEVIVPANTYIATALAVSDVGADVVLVDCDPATHNIDTGAVEAAVTSKTKALLPVHFAGQAADMDPLLRLADEKRLMVVEDAAQAHGTRYRNQPCGSLGTIACFSFYPGKNLGAYGDGGMITTNDEAIVEQSRRLRNYGERAKYEHVIKGVNSRLDGLQAAFLTVKLRHLDRWNDQRAQNAARYAEQLVGVGDIVVQQRVDASTHVYHLFVIETDSRDALREHLTGLGIDTGIHYPTPIHLQEAYRELGLGPGAFSNAERLARRCLSLPMYAELTEGQISRVTDAVRSFFA